METGDLVREISNCYQSYNHKTAEDVRPFYEAIDLDGDIYGDPVLWYAAKHADHVGIEILLARGADAAYQDQYSYNALHKMAYEAGRSQAPWADEEKAATLLIDAGASVLRKDTDGVTCTHIAAERGRLGMIRALVASGKKLDLTNKSGETALHLACDRTVRAAHSYYTYTKAHYDESMAETADTEWAQTQLAKKRAHNKEQADRDKGVLDSYFEILKCLLAAGLDPDQKDNYGKTSKDIAFDCMDIRVPALLEGSYQEGDEQDEGKRIQMLTKGMNLMQATEKRDYDAVEALLKLGADPNELYGDSLHHYGLDLQGKAPLAMACSFPDARLTGLLLEHGANPGLKDAQGKIPLLYGKVGNKELETILKEMVDKGLDVNLEADERGRTLLLHTCIEADSSTGGLIRLLLKYKADPNIADNHGMTPLMVVCKESSRYAEDYQLSLLEAGADVSARDKNGETALMHAARNRSDALAKTLAEMLFEFGDPLPEAVNNNEESALAIATGQNNENLVNYLLAKL